MTANTAIYVDSKDFVFKLNDGSTLQDLSADIVSHDFTSKIKLNDITTYGKTGTIHGASLEDSTFTITFLWNQVATTGSHTVVGKIHNGQKVKQATYGAVAFEADPAGTVAGNTKITGSCWVGEYKLIGKVGDRQTVEVPFTVDGDLTFTTN